MDIKQFFILRIILLVAFLLVQPLTNASERPNIVFILADDLGWNGVGCYGSNVIPTPNIDRLAQEGMRFTDAYVMSQCLPTRCAFFSGQYGARTRFTSVERESPDYLPMKSPGRPPGLSGDTYTIFNMLKDAGYTTGMAGKWHLDSNYSPKKIFASTQKGGSKKNTKRQSKEKKPNLQKGIEKKGMAFFKPFGLDWVSRVTQTPTDKVTLELAEDLLTFIKKNKDKPFVAYLSHYTVHGPLVAPKELIDKYVKLGFTKSTKLEGRIEERPTADYLAMTDLLDQSVGMVMDGLRELGLEENTLIIFMSDNGGMHRAWDNKPLRGWKGQLYEGGIRVPMIARWPKQIKSRTVASEPVHIIDLFPTFMKLANADYTRSPKEHILDGIDISPILLGKKTDTGSPVTLARKALYSHHPEYIISYAKAPSSSIRKGDFKLIYHFGDYLDPNGVPQEFKKLTGRVIVGERIELFNLKEDLGESVDLSKSMPEKVEELMADLRAWWKETDAQFPEKNLKQDPSQWIWNDLDSSQVKVQR